MWPKAPGLEHSEPGWRRPLVVARQRVLLQNDPGASRAASPVLRLFLGTVCSTAEDSAGPAHPAPNLCTSQKTCMPVQVSKSSFLGNLPSH